MSKVLVYEIGSTTTLVNAFTDLDTENPRFVGGAQAPTTVTQGDVTLGLRQALDELKSNFPEESFEEAKILASSSAAGGLKMTVHGLVEDMTVKAAKEAALGAGANISFLTSGKLRRTDISKIKKISPNIILIAGGVDYGERDTAIYNAELIAALPIEVPVIYAGNSENDEEIRLIFEEEGKAHLLHIVENVYPRIDQLNILPTRKVIQAVFEEHIIHAKGMEKIREVVDSHVVPTPGSVMMATELISEICPDVMTIDVGGATTDVHSVTQGSEEIGDILISPEPLAKRTVEGDLGLFINHENIRSIFANKELQKSTGLSEEELNYELLNYYSIPETENAKKLVKALTKKAVITSIHRHAGHLIDLYFSGGKKSAAMGKDLTKIRAIIGTGGALTQIEGGEKILLSIPDSNKGDRLLPQEGVKVYLDHWYIMASLGVMSMEHPKSALKLLLASLNLEENDICIENLEEE
ncbi:MAG TPA: GlmL-related ornithine degradation protein [Clostridia bacterium]|nr:GlmL-related ornithine degradation protein [Clostridia bacterium]